MEAKETMGFQNVHLNGNGVRQYLKEYENYSINGLRKIGKTTEFL